MFSSFLFLFFLALSCLALSCSSEKQQKHTPPSSSSFLFELDQVLHISFNQDYSSFALGTTKGFVVYSCDPLRERFRRDFGRGIGIVEMLGRSNILALVGGGPNPYAPPSKVIIWDDAQGKALLEYDFSREIRAIRAHGDVISLVLDGEVFVHSIRSLDVLTTLYTASSPYCMCSIGDVSPGVVAIATLGARPDSIHVERVNVADGSSESHAFCANRSYVSMVHVSPDGRYVASTSEKAYYVLVFETSSGKGNLVREFLRGNTSSEITSLCFSPDNSLLLASSASGTAHIFEFVDHEKGMVPSKK